MKVILWSNGTVYAIMHKNNELVISGDIKDVGYDVLEKVESIKPEVTNFAVADIENGFINTNYFSFERFVEENFPKPEECIVKGCENRSDQGKFIGDLCSPCHEFVTTGKGKFPQSFKIDGKAHE